MKHTNKLIILSVILTVILCLTLASCQDSENESVSTDETKVENTSVTETTEATTDSETDSTEETTANSETDSTEETTVNSETKDTEETTVTPETENNEPYEIKVDDYTLLKNENGCYLTFDDISKYQNNSSSGSMVASEIIFGSIKEFKDTVTKGLLTEWQKAIVADFSSNSVDIQTCDFNNLYEPTLPENSNILETYWTGTDYYFSISKDNVYFGFLEVLNEDSYSNLYTKNYENRLNNSNITITSTEEIDGKEIIYYKTSTGRSLYVVRYTLTIGNKIVTVDKKYYSSETIPLDIKLYCVEGSKYYIVNFDKVYEDPTDEWLLQFGLKRYVENDHEVM